MVKLLVSASVVVALRRDPKGKYAAGAWVRLVEDSIDLNKIPGLLCEAQGGLGETSVAVS
jgi:hypothetical protein